jgi:hypothetical protein
MMMITTFVLRGWRKPQNLIQRSRFYGVSYDWCDKTVVTHVFVRMWKASSTLCQESRGKQQTTISGVSNGFHWKIKLVMICRHRVRLPGQAEACSVLRRRYVIWNIKCEYFTTSKRTLITWSAFILYALYWSLWYKNVTYNMFCVRTSLLWRCVAPSQKHNVNSRVCTKRNDCRWKYSPHWCYHVGCNQKGRGYKRIWATFRFAIWNRVYMEGLLASDVRLLASRRTCHKLLYTLWLRLFCALCTMCLKGAGQVCPSAWFNSRTVERIWMKFGMDVMSFGSTILS